MTVTHPLLIITPYRLLTALFQASAACSSFSELAILTDISLSNMRPSRRAQAALRLKKTFWSFSPPPCQKGDSSPPAATANCRKQVLQRKCKQRVGGPTRPFTVLLSRVYQPSPRSPWLWTTRRLALPSASPMLRCVLFLSLKRLTSDLPLTRNWDGRTLMRVESMFFLLLKTCTSRGLGEL